MEKTNLLIVLSLISGVAFIYYGISCFKSKRIKLEFNRYGLPHRLKLTGTLQILGGMGLLAGLYLSNILAFISSLGLTLLMLLGFSVRLRLKDSAIDSAPSLIFAVLNLYICIRFLQIIFV